jgi:hypothetical protein
MKEYIFSNTAAYPYDRIREGDWVAYDCYTNDKLTSIGKVIGFIPKQKMVVLEAPNYPYPKIINRSCLDLDMGQMRKITNPNI